MAKYSEEKIQEVVTLYLSGKSQKEVSEITGVGASTVGRYVKKAGYSLRKKKAVTSPKKYSRDKELEIIRLYTEENKNTNEIAKIYGTYNTTIRRILLRNNIEIRTYGVAQRKVKLEDIKSKEHTRDFDYFLGVLATDGCVTGDRIVLDFSEENKELLSYWNEFLGNKCNINTSIHKVFKVPQYRIAFRNPDIAQYLATFGIVPRKTFDLQLKYINWDVLRGIIDGDGCIASMNNHTTLRILITSGCKKFLDQIQLFLNNENIPSHINVSKGSKNPVYNLSVNKSEDVLKMFYSLYHNAHYFLKRKYEKFGPLVRKLTGENLVNSVNERALSKTEPSLIIKEGAETRNEEPKINN